MKTDIVCIYGKHPVEAALREKPEAIQKLFIDKEQYPELDAEAKQAGIFRTGFSMKDLQKHIGRDAAHQHIAAFIDVDALVIPFEEFIGGLAVTNKTALTLLGELQDPHNVGAIIRSASAFGLSGVLIPERRQAPITGAVIKASVGTAFRIPLVEIGNVNQTIERLKQVGFWMYGLSGDAKQPIAEEQFDAPSVIVIGNEGKGIREKTEEHCDALLKIPMAGGVESLNASVSAAIAFYEWSKKK